jgi:DNA-binding transcriptional ArsR family regulator
VTATEDRVFAALSSTIRREVLRILREEGPQAVAPMAVRFDMTRPSFSEQLRVLREAGLVSERKVGRQRIYQLEPEPLLKVADWLGPYERFWRQRLAALGSVLNDMEET